MIEPLVLDETFRDLLDQMENLKGNLFITGRAGTGKSTLLQLFRKTTHKKVVVLSPTGISALHVQGQTIHSFFRFPPKLLHRDDLHPHAPLVRLLKNVETIIIDEISMVRADVMDAINTSLIIHRRIDEPFGGIQMIFFGDLFQLPPVVSSQEERLYFNSTYESPYFFSAHIFKETGLPILVELTKVFRQRDMRFIRLLDKVRHLDCEYEDLDEINERYQPEEEPPHPYLTLCSTNAKAQEINHRHIQAIDSPEKEYLAELKGEFHERLYPTDYRLKLKPGCQVIMLRNHPERKFVNGSLGTIIQLNEESIIVDIIQADGNEERITVSPMQWDILRYQIGTGDDKSITSHVTGSFIQFPLKLAWAVTIHKSQGQTYDRVKIDLGKGAFEFGQTYVALSRCRSLKGIYLERPVSMRDILVDTRVVNFYSEIR